MQTDIDHHFDLNSCSRDTDKWLYNENQQLYVELSDFSNYE